MIGQTVRCTFVREICEVLFFFFFFCLSLYVGKEQLLTADGQEVDSLIQLSWRRAAAVKRSSEDSNGHAKPHLPVRKKNATGRQSMHDHTVI